MPVGDDLPEIPAGFPLAELRGWLNRLRAMVLRGRVSVDAGSGLSALSGAGGIALALGTAAPLRIGKTQAGGVTARSGTTPGTGTVDWQTYRGGALVAAGQAGAVLNFYGAAFGATKYVGCVQIDGQWWALTQEC
jgi:hypothetical protein